MLNHRRGPNSHILVLMDLDIYRVSVIELITRP